MMKTAQSHRFQSDPDQGWCNMIMYWAVGALVGMRVGYLPFSVFDNNIICPTHLKVHTMTTLVTVAVQPLLLSRFGPFDRCQNRNYAVFILFAVMNGVFETVLFLGSYDAGKHITKLVCKQDWVAIMMGLVAFTTYSALIHAAFWLPHAFPRHTLESAPPFHTNMLPVLMLMSTTWMMDYELTGNVEVVMLSHMLTDYLGAAKMNLQPPIGGKKALA